FRHDRGSDDVAVADRGAVSDPRKKISAQQCSCCLLEHDTSIPTMRHMWRIDVAKTLASDVDDFAVREYARRPIRHIADRNTTAHHPVHKLSRRRNCSPF